MVPKYASTILFCLAIIFLLLLPPVQTFGQAETKEQKIRRLTSELQTGGTDTQKKAAFELAIIGNDAVPTLINSLRTNRNPEVLGELVGAFCIVGNDAVPALISTLDKGLKAKDDLVLRHTANALACIADISKNDPALKDAVPILIGILETGKENDLAQVEIFKHKDFTNVPIDGNREIIEINDNLQAFDAAAHCLGRIGREAKDAVPLLIEILRNEKSREGGYGKLESINLIITDLIRNSDFSANDKITNAFKEYESELKEKDRINLERRIDILKKAKEAQANVLREVVTEYRYIIGIAILFLGWLSIFALKPLWLLKIYELLPAGETHLSGVSGTVTVSIQHLLSPWIFRPHVLDAWVKKHLRQAHQSFSNKQTVKDRQVYVPVGLFLNDKLVSEIAPQDLHETFARNQSRLLISGVGGAGKTSLACHFAHWAMKEKVDERLCPDHLMIPVLLEHDFVENDEDALKKAILAQFYDSIDADTPVSNTLLQALLEKKRLLVLVDGVSEMNDRTQNAVLSGIIKIPVNAVIFTSRGNETIGDLNKTVIKPTKIKGNQLSSFVETYLTSLGRKELFEDEEFFEGCRLLSMIVNDRNITALLAKLFVEQMVAKQEKTIDEDLPKNIPELMLQSIKVLHAKTPSDALALRDVIKAAKVIAWECLKKDYRPLSADYEEVKKSLVNLPNGEKSLNYLKDKLKLIETTAFDAKVRFKIDPLAEYLAGMYLVEENKYDEDKWRKFFATALLKSGSPENITGFLLAVRDCCMTEDAKDDVPSFVVDELTKITKIDP